MSPDCNLVNRLFSWSGRRPNEPMSWRGVRHLSWPVSPFSLGEQPVYLPKKVIDQNQNSLLYDREKTVHVIIATTSSNLLDLYFLPRKKCRNVCGQWLVLFNESIGIKMYLEEWGQRSYVRELRKDIHVYSHTTDDGRHVMAFGRMS